MKKPSRKDLIRAYREAARPMGVYRVYSRQGSCSVVGSSRDLTSALNRHRAQLDLGAHPDKALQAEWDALGSAAFEFEVLDSLTPGDDPGYDPGEDLEELESLWRERLSEA